MRMAMQSASGAPIGRDPTGDDVLTLESADLSLTVAPGRGGRIVSLMHRPTGREVLWTRPPRLDWPRYGVSEGEADIQGWDECCPAIGPGDYGPGPWAGVRNPAQGEVYALPWRVRHVDRRRAVLAVHGVRFPYDLERELSLGEPNTVRARYRIANHAAAPFPFIWSAHPLLAVGAGARVILPGTMREVVVDSTDGGRLGPVYSAIAWPHARAPDGTASDLAEVQPATGWADKVYIPAVEEGRCALVRSDGLSVAITWDPGAIPSLGLWLDTRGRTRVSRWSRVLDTQTLSPLRRDGALARHCYSMANASGR